MKKHAFRQHLLFNDHFFASLEKDIRHAKKTIDLETYIFSNDRHGQSIANALKDAAMRGVKVRVLVDGFGTSHWGNRFTSQLKKAGVITRVYHPLPSSANKWLRPKSANVLWKIFYSFTRINKRNHRKTCMIDRKIVYVGSANLNASYQVTEHKKLKFIDVSVKTEPIHSSELQYAFEKAWGNLSILKKTSHFIKQKTKDPLFRLNYSWRLRRRLNRSIITKFNDSKKRIWISNAYFIANSRLLKALRKAAKRGVDVRILLSKNYEYATFGAMTRSYYYQLINAGVKIAEYKIGILHEKTLLVDDWGLVGTSNMNYRSLVHDLEVDVVLKSKKARVELEKHFLENFKSAIEIDKNKIPRSSLVDSILGRILLFLRYWF